jgi:hypothetical protein
LRIAVADEENAREARLNLANRSPSGGTDRASRRDLAEMSFIERARLAGSSASGP